ncbi:hypothetical protein POVWA2_031830 [Plasmodium ovale wallikeri]|uniref:Uncharacterized protein n=1 Tax=Plasmodium ovale wallikeri TaxID=864142 RepID=A0A1A8YYF8_PLAOA|nr:hypothetical protein POVWA1_032110 [Plasmodium ovale wallikeri]SBT36756.1 hypothetical protein POVWA2_031830 [Plasmodium ovale wallikeri]
MVSHRIVSYRTRACYPCDTKKEFVCRKQCEGVSLPLIYLSEKEETSSHLQGRYTRVKLCRAFDRLFMNHH